jgi:protein-L-isoaspartate(D-aspartate) O-methyltransferase
MGLKPFIPLYLLTVAAALSAQHDHPAFSERQEERWKLVYGELAEYQGIRIYDAAVLEAMYAVPRHAFVPENMQPYAYVNTPLPIGYDQTISQPLIVASMTQLLEPGKDQKILEIGTGSGYQAAVLAEMEAEVYTIEIVPELGTRAKNTLHDLGYAGVHVKTGDGYAGWPEHAPFDRIIVTCAPEDVPGPLVEQLKPGGKIVIPIGPENATQFLVVLRKTEKGRLIRDFKYPVRFVPMTGKAREQQ